MARQCITCFAVARLGCNQLLLPQAFNWRAATFVLSSM